VSELSRIATAARGAALACALAALIAGCASTAKNGTASASSMNASTTASSGSMAGMNMGASSASSAVAVPEVNGIKPIPTQMLATATWQGMKIEARTMTAAPFIVYNGTSEQMVKPGPKTSFHLMVMLNDAHTGVTIPYATVWATISKAGKIVYDERQWPMLSAFMGPHYGNNVSLPGPGTYRLSLLISPPVSARHLEYENVWLHPHRVTVTFPWKPA